MISFELTAEQQDLKKRFHELSQDKFRRLSLEADASAPGPLTPDLKKIISDYRLNAFIIPREVGGLAVDRLTLSIVTEEIGYGSAAVASIYAATVHAVSALLIGGSDEQKKRFLPLLLEGEGAVAGCAITEEKGGSDTSYFQTTAEKKKETYVLNGTKGPVLNAGNASFYLVFASDPAKSGKAAINAFLVPHDAKGLSIGPYHHKVGLRGAPTAHLRFDQVEIPQENLIGLPGSGYLLLMQTLDLGRAFFGAICVGLARAALEHIIAFTKEREILDRPIIKNQGISFLIAELSTDLEAARLLVWKACRLMDLEKDYTRESSMAKLFASETAFKTTSEGMQILGQKGVLSSSLMDMFQRDAQALRIVEGTGQIQKMIIASQF